MVTSLRARLQKSNPAGQQTLHHGLLEGVGLVAAGCEVNLHPDAVPNADQAVINPDKLRRYALDTGSEKGMHKARVFASALGFTKENAGALEDQLLAGLKVTAATERKSTEFGRTYTVDIPVSGPVGGGIVRTGWHIDTGTDIPRLVSAYVVRG